MSKNVVVLGLGNILLKDEGVGVRIIENFRERFDYPDDLDVFDGGTSGIDMIDFIANRDHLIITDAVKTGDPAGSIVILKDDDVAAFFKTKISPHQLGISDLLALLDVSNERPKEMTIIGVVPMDMGTGLEMSEPIQGQAVKGADVLADTLSNLGISVSRKQQLKVS